ncbi:MAG: S-layer homology domain-containing protein [Vallitaleaceae bacterium]|nr:S-layer homology domain-containing protein [Vallitaleaceae bacterium]
MKTCFLLLLNILFLEFFFSDTSTYALDYDHAATMNYEDLLDAAYELAENYPDFIQIETLGYSVQGKEIVSLTLSKGAEASIGMDAGIHARENITSFILLETLERYAEELSSPGSHSFSYDLHDLIENLSIRTILNANPDGFELLLQDPSWKANKNGVDLNRNFACEYYNGVDWIPFWGVEEGEEKPYYYSERPSAAYFSGYAPDSEPETKTIKDFYQSFDFRSYLSIHTRGQLLFFERTYLPSLYQFRSKDLAEEIRSNNQFYLMDSTLFDEEDSYYSSSGTITDWLSGEFLKPAITIELMPASSLQPPPQALWADALEDFLNVPLAMMSQALQSSYYDFKVYVNQEFYADYPTLNYAYGVAAKYKGFVAIYKGSPHEWTAANELKQKGIIKGDLRIQDKVTRMELLTLLIRSLYPMDFVPEVADFKDVGQAHWGYSYANLARYYGLASGKYLNPNDFISKEEALTTYGIASSGDFLTRGDVFLYISRRLKGLSL